MEAARRRSGVGARGKSLTAAFACLCYLTLGHAAIASANSPSVEGESVSGLTATNATLEAEVNPQGAPNGVFVQFQLLLDPGEAPTEIACPPSPPAGYSACVGSQSADALPIRFVSGEGAQTVALDLSQAGVTLKPGHNYFFRALAANRISSEDSAEWESPAVVGDSTGFTTPVPPAILAQSIAGVTQTDANLKAVINGEGQATTYKFEIAKSPACLPPTPPFTPCFRIETGNLPQATIPASLEDHSVSVDLNVAGLNLEPGATYDFRIVASSPAGKSEGPTTTFSTLPPQACALSTVSGGCPSSPISPPRRCRRGTVMQQGTCMKRTRCHHRHHHHRNGHAVSRARLCRHDHK